MPRLFSYVVDHDYGYQYADDQSDSGNRKSRITMNWRRIEEINSGDRFVAYLPTNRFSAVGSVRTPRRPKARHDRTDTIDKYLERRESYHEGYVYFTSVVYENFTDELDGYPVRIDVDEWEKYVPEGIVLPIVNKIALNERQKAVFEITRTDCDRIVKKLASGNGSSSVAADGPAATELSKAASQVDETGYFSPGSLKDEREKKLREIVERRGQPDFRNKLITAYGGRCAVTGCDVVEGITDIEIHLPGHFHVIVEAKVGLAVPTIEQCQKYLPRIKATKVPIQKLVAVVQSPDQTFVKHYGQQDKQLSKKARAFHLAATSSGMRSAHAGRVAFAPGEGMGSVLLQLSGSGVQHEGVYDRSLDSGDQH